MDGGGGDVTDGLRSNVDGRPAALFAQTGCVAASMGGAAPPSPTVVLIVKANVDRVAQLRHRAVDQATLPRSLPPLFSIECSSIKTIHDALAMDSIVTMLSLLLLSPFEALVLREMLLHVKGSSQLFWLKVLMRLLVDGQRHQMVHMHGDIVSELNQDASYRQLQLRTSWKIFRVEFAKRSRFSWQRCRDIFQVSHLVLDDTTRKQPSSHNVIIGNWKPSNADTFAGRVPGYGVITNIINGGLECGHGPDNRVADRIGFYKRYCDILGVSYGSNLACYNQKPFA
ncbi:unnamed protein product [Citrullus colocynthis]|uniref:Glycoside hydrolase family 19 catalytic domain-containing protein n=1 Tax=Citrullus colocynthis TaxID=252529 RepID=A0ABP0YJZ1_9ROSI